MTKQEFLAMSLPYGLKAEFKEVESPTCRKKVIGTINGVYDDGTIVCHDTVNATPSKFKPIVRPLSDLTKEITQANYNDGKPFIPYIELLKMSYFDTENMTTEELEEYKAGYFASNLDQELMLLSDAIQLVKWHFDLITEECEKVYVTDQFNSYK